MQAAEVIPRQSVAGVPSHAPAFRRRRFGNWFPLGCTYACLYMGRYNFNVSKGTIGAIHHFNKAQMGLVATAGFWIYAASVLINGPLADRFGGRRAILIGTFGSCLLNLMLAVLLGSGWDSKLIAGMSLLYGLNMYFQSFGALSVVKVNQAWFHVRERGVFGGLFGGMIALGYWLAYGVCGWFVEHLPLWAVYAIPSLILLLAFVADALIVRNRPSQAGYADFATGDEGDGDTKGTLEPSPREPEGGYREPVPGVRPDGEPTFLEIAKSAFGHPVIRWLTVAEFCTGIVRQGLLLYFPEFLAEVHGVKPGTSLFFVASTGITVGGVLGSLLAGVLSDKVFQSRRPPVALIFYVLQMLFLVVLGFSRGPLVASLLIGTTCTWIFGVHGMLSGTASQDFGGKKAAATAAGLLDGVQYLGSGLTGVGLGALLDRYHWGIWPFCLVPFSLAGLFIMAKLWNAKPGAHAH